jgi:DNA-binding transcriptional MerR regulator
MNERERLDTLRIGQLAAMVGLNPKTIRYYEQLGLLSTPVRTEAGYRVFTATDRDRLLFIRKAKALGLTLEEIGQILTLRLAGTAPCAHVIDLIERKLIEVRAQQQALLAFEQDLRRLRAEAQRTMSEAALTCGVIEHATLRQRDDTSCS